MKNLLVFVGHFVRILDFVAFGRLVYKKNLLTPKPNTENKVKTLVNQLVEDEDAAVIEEPTTNTQVVEQEVDQDKNKDNVVVEYAGETMVDTVSLLSMYQVEQEINQLEILNSPDCIKSSRA